MFTTVYMSISLVMEKVASKMKKGIVGYANPSTTLITISLFEKDH